jgi:hypothetical protein
VLWRHLNHAGRRGPALAGRLHSRRAACEGAGERACAMPRPHLSRGGRGTAALPRRRASRAARGHPDPRAIALLHASAYPSGPDRSSGLDHPRERFAESNRRQCDLPATPLPIGNRGWIALRTTPLAIRLQSLKAWRGASSGHEASEFSEASRSLATVAETLGARVKRQQAFAEAEQTPTRRSRRRPPALVVAVSMHERRGTLSSPTRAGV